jgi:hypothetical protein
MRGACATDEVGARDGVVWRAEGVVEPGNRLPQQRGNQDRVCRSGLPGLREPREVHRLPESASDDHCPAASPISGHAAGPRAGADRKATPMGLAPMLYEVDVLLRPLVYSCRAWIRPCNRSQTT